MNELVVYSDGNEFRYNNSLATVHDGTLIVFYPDNNEGHTVFAEGAWDSVTNYTSGIPSSGDWFDEIAAFMLAGGQEVPESPRFGEYLAHLLPFEGRTREEVNETLEAISNHNLAETVDGFLDTAYVAITGAIRAVGVDAARACWEAICDANTAKIDGRHGDVVRDKNTGKILKPEGWEAPNIGKILYEHDETD